MSICYIALVILIGYVVWRFPNVRKTWYWLPQKGLVAFMYHHIGNLENPSDEQYPFTISPKMFEQHLLFLKEKGYTAISLKDLQEGSKEIKKPVLLTFDDGYSDNYTLLFPLLKKYMMPATIFLTVNKIGQDGYLTWEQVKEMHKSGIISFGSHTLNHKRLRSLPNEEIWMEIVESKKIIEEQLQEEVLSFCYPYGAGGFDKRVRPLVFKAGYKFDFSTKKGINKWPWNAKKSILRAFPRNGEDLFDYHLQLTRGRSKL